MDRQSRAKRIADLHVFYGQNEVVEELIRAGKIDEEYMYPFVDMDGPIDQWGERDWMKKVNVHIVSCGYRPP